MADRWPESQDWTAVTPELAEFLGLMVADGCVPAGHQHVDFANNDESLRLRITQLWSKVFLGRVKASTLRSGWNPEVPVEHLRLTGAPSATAWLREQLYTRTGLKQVPPIILNADAGARQAFLEGYYAGDGLKRGNGESVKTNSAGPRPGAVLALRARRSSRVGLRRAARTAHLLPAQSAVGGSRRSQGSASAPRPG